MAIPFVAIPFVAIPFAAISFVVRPIFFVLVQLSLMRQEKPPHNPIFELFQISVQFILPCFSFNFREEECLIKHDSVSCLRPLLFFSYIPNETFLMSEHLCTLYLPSTPNILPKYSHRTYSTCMPHDLLDLLT